MVSGFSEFSWDVYIDGYFWVDALFYPPAGPEQGFKPGRYLVVKYDERWLQIPEFQKRSYDLFRNYDPLLDYSALFKTFADVDPAEASIAAFANKYGQLGGHIAKTCYVWHQLLPPLTEIQPSDLPFSVDGEYPYYRFLGDTLSGWRREIKAMKRAVALWEHLTTDDSRRLYSYLEKEWEAEASSVLLDLHRSGKLLPWGNELLGSTINAHLLKRISPEMRSGQSKHDMGLKIVPDSLIGALWLQFALAVDGNKEYKQCKMCSSWFEIGRTESYSPEAGFCERARKDKTYCSNACRSRALREKKKEARRLYENSITIDEIAKTLGSKPDTVRGWVGK